MDFGLQGSIEKFTLPEIFQLIAAGRKSGTLGIQKDDSIVMIYFDKGEILYGYGPRQTYHLGQLLREKGKLSNAQLEQAVSIQAKSENSKRLGEILIERGFIDRIDLQAVVTRQVEQLLYSLMAWKTGSFKFYENQYPTEEEITVKISVENVILEGLRRLDEANMVKDALPDTEAVYVISAAQGQRDRAVSMQAEEWNMMALVDGHRSLNEVAKLSGMPEEDALKKLAHLKLAGLITKTDRKGPGKTPQLEQAVNRLANLFEEYLTEKSVDRSGDRKISQTYVEL